MLEQGILRSRKILGRLAFKAVCQRQLAELGGSEYSSVFAIEH